MQRDARGLELSTDSARAVALFDLAVEHFLKFHADTMNLANEAVAEDPGFVMGHCLRGYLLLAGANPALRPAVSACLAAAGGGVASQREQRHVAALAAWRETAEQAWHNPSSPYRAAARAHALGTLLPVRRQVLEALGEEGVLLTHAP